MAIFVLKEKINLLNDIGFESFYCLRPKVKQLLSLNLLLTAKGCALGAVKNKCWR